MLAAGARAEETEDREAEFLPAEEALRVPFDRGRLLCPRQWYRGLRATLRRLAADLADVPGAAWMSHPDEIVTLFDKRRCHALFRGAGLPVPAGLGPVRSFDELLGRMEATGLRRVFIKLACGSSASGVVAFRTGGRRVQALTTVEAERRGGRLCLYNTRRLRRYEDAAEIGPVVDALSREGVHVEEWVPKAATQGQSFDLRVLVIAGQVRHIVPRLSRQPMTNLHLLNRRGDLGAVCGQLPPGAWEAAMMTCARAAGLFPRCHHVGIDVLFTPSFRRHALLEANAFGDLLPGIQCNGLDPYEAELAALDRQGEGTD